jgi:hypothetical protein
MTQSATRRYLRVDIRLSLEEFLLVDYPQPFYSICFSAAFEFLQVLLFFLARRDD